MAAVSEDDKALVRSASGFLEDPEMPEGMVLDSGGGELLRCSASTSLHCVCLDFHCGALALAVCLRLDDELLSDGGKGGMLGDCVCVWWGGGLLVMAEGRR